LITKKAANRLNGHYDRDEFVHITCGNNTSVNTLGTVNLSIKLGHKIIEHRFFVVDKLIFPLVIGNDIIIRHKIVPNLSEETFHFSEDPSRIYKLGDAQGKFILLTREISRLDVSASSPEGRVESLLDFYPSVARKDGTVGQTSFAVHKIAAPDEPSLDIPIRS
jgi:hypothetical protein